MNEYLSLGIEARVGARWWADKIRDGFTPDAGAEPGDAIESPMAKGLISTLQRSMSEKITPERIDAYEQALAVEIQRMLDDNLTSYSTALELGCDYGPSHVHIKALQEADLPTSSVILPWKTTMWVQPGKVKVGDGYGAEPIELPLEER